jgi:filamentous hemagglutinin family protein
MATYREDWRFIGFFKGIAAIALTGGCAIVFENSALAQSNIVPDASLGAESSVVVPNVDNLPVEVIEGGAQRGQNLFHSFEQFNVLAGREAYFFSPNAAIENILARVTGTNRSDILGTLGTYGNSQPNLFLINPNGIVFGENAQLNVGGSFFASTANSLVFDNGFEFSAANPQAPPLLTINVPFGLQYDANPGSIVNQSVVGLQVQTGKILALVGGDVTMQNSILFAPQGSIELGSVAGNSRVNLIPTSTGYTLGYENVENFQDIRLTQNAFVFTNDNINAGSIQVQGRNVTLSDGSFIATTTFGSGKGGDLIINASESVQVIGTSADGRSSSLSAGTSGTGDAGDIRITTPALLVRDGAAVTAGTSDVGKGGNLIINASNSVQVIGTTADGQFGSNISANASGAGDAGDIRITTRELLVGDGAGVNAGTLSAGKGGNLIINASDSVQVIGESVNGQFGSGLLALTTSDATGDAGNLTITTGQLLISDGATLNVGTLGVGKGGSLIINASDSVQVIGRSADGEFGSLLSSGTLRTGDAGEMRITTGQLLIADGATINAGTFGAGKGGNLIINASEGVQVMGRSADGEFGSNLSVQANGNMTGNAGDLTITTPRLLILDGAFVSADTHGSGRGGNLTVNASDSVQVIGTSTDGEFRSYLTADTLEVGNAGDLTITTPRLLISDGALVSASTFDAGNGGNLTVNASESVQVIGRSADGEFGSNLSVEATADATGNAGDLTITTSELLISDGAQVSATTSGSGKAGNLIVNASESVQVIGRSADGEFGSNLSVQANANATGNAGDLTITTPGLLISGGAFVSADTYGSGRGGSLIVDASDSVQVIGTSTDGEFASYLSVQANDNTIGNAGNLTINTSELVILDGAFVSADTYGSGKGGNLTVDASESVQVIGTSADGEFRSFLSADTLGTGDAGDLTITTPELVVLDGALVSTDTYGAGKGGNLTVNASESVQVIGESADIRFASQLTAQTQGTGNAGNLTISTGQLLVRDGAQVSAGTLGTGEGGDLIVNASESVQVIGRSADGEFFSGLFASAPNGGIAGDLSVTTSQMTVQDGARVTVSSPSGQAGNLSITTDSLFLNRGRITAETAESRAEGGANINLQVSEVWLMGNESLVAATAFDSANGGNINIDTQFLVALPPEGSNGSDIIANADRGNGGRINITTQGIFGIEFRDELTPDNDITATSDFGLDGEFILTQPDIDPSRGLAELPTDVVDGTRQIDRRCTPGGAAQDNSFTITGRGGLPPNPTDPLTSEAVIADWVTLNSEENTNRVTPEANPTSATPKLLVEAQSWTYSPNGQVVLVAQAPTVTPQRPWQASPSCDDFQATAH